MVLPALLTLDAAGPSSTDASHGLLYALIGAVAVLIPALLTFIWRAKRERRMGPKEEQETVARTAQEAVEASLAALKAVREERQELREKIERLEEASKRKAQTIVSQNKRVAGLEERMRECETCNGELQAEVNRLRGGGLEGQIRGEA